MNMQASNNDLRTRRARTHERGSVLIVAMVFLVILTILGVSSMTTSQLELKMAVNHQYANLAFQAAESGIDRVLGTDDLKSILGTDDTFEDTEQFTFGDQEAADGTPLLKAETVTNYVTESLAPGYSIPTPALHYVVRSVGTAGSASAQTTQGFFVIGATGGT